MVFVLDSKFVSIPAKKGNVKDAIRMIEILNNYLKGDEDLDSNARKYFIKCFDDLLDGIEKHDTNKKRHPHIAKSLNLHDKRGRRLNKENAYRREAELIYQIQSSRDVSVEEAIKILKTDPAYKDIKVTIDHRALRNAYKKHLESIEAWDWLKNCNKLAVRDLQKALKRLES